jgi:arylsulfatase A-like enzyme
MFTGQYPHNTGVMVNGNRWERSWVELLNRNGYHCVNIGKMHQAPYNSLLGFHERHPVENKDRFMEGRYFIDEWDKALNVRGCKKPGRLTYRNLSDYRERLGAFEWTLPPELHSDNFVADRACWWLRHYPKTEPLFLEIGFPGPHPPYDPPLDEARPYLEKDLPILEVAEEELDAQPDPYRGMIQHNCDVDHDSVVHQWNPTPEQRKRQRAYYLANVTMIDRKIGQILKTLEETGYLDNTVVLFTSDHGDALTDHGHSQKWTMYDVVTRMPLIVWAPGRFQGGRKIDGLCSLIDIGPTILDLAQVSSPPKMEARSLLAAVEGGDWKPREAVYCEQGRDVNFTTSNYQSMIRTTDWKLVCFSDCADGQLFDLQSDPDEVQNLWCSPEHADKKMELLDELRRWREHSAYHYSGWRQVWPA